MTLAIKAVKRSAFRRANAAMRFALPVFLGLLFLAADSRGKANTPDDPSLFGVFVGSSPGGESISPLLHIPADLEPPIQWKLTLYQDPKSQVPAGYKLRCDYTAASSKASAKRGTQSRLEKEGTWRLAKGTKVNPDAVAYELDGLLSLFKVDENILHVLNPDRGLMVGNGGWSFTLNRATAAEKPEPPPPANAPEVSYTLSPLATGPAVYGVFEGRSPCVGIARELEIGLDLHRMKAKWRVTLYQNPETKVPTTYKVEGTLHKRSAREGSWAIIHGMEADPTAIVYRLEPAKEEEALFLLKGDDNVLFFLDQKRKPLVGHADFSYTLNRRAVSAESKASSTAQSR
jgi:hypothetical protein